MCATPTAPPPKYVSFRQIRLRFGLPRKFVVNQLVARGRVRSIKASSARSARRLYRAADLERALLELESTGAPAFPREGVGG